MTQQVSPPVPFSVPCESSLGVGWGAGRISGGAGECGKWNLGEPDILFKEEEQPPVALVFQELPDSGLGRQGAQFS